MFTSRGARGKSAAIPPPCLNIWQLHSITAVGVVINDKLNATDHLSSLLTSCSSSLYAIRVLRDDGLPASLLHETTKFGPLMAKIGLLFSPTLRNHHLLSGGCHHVGLRLGVPRFLVSSATVCRRIQSRVCR